MIERTDPQWSDSYQCLRPPTPGASLAEYSLSLDNLNGLEAGDTFRATRRIATGPAQAEPAFWLSGAGIDLEGFARLAARPLAGVEHLTLRPLLRWLYGESFRDTLTRRRIVAVRRSFALCPLCAEQGRIALWSLLANVRGCLTHGLLLQDRCSCGGAIRLFEGGPIFTCVGSFCGKSYAALPAVLLTAAERFTLQTTTTQLDDMNAIAQDAGTALSREELTGAFQALLLDQPRTSGANSADRPSLTRILDALARTETSVTAWVNSISTPGIRHSQFNRRRGEPADAAPALFSEAVPECPVCRSNGLYKRGSPAGLGELEYLCKSCGTRFTKRRLLFSFDPHPRYPAWRTVKNAAALAALGLAVARVSARRVAMGQSVRRVDVFSEAGVPKSSSYATPRAGLVAILADARLRTKYS